MPYICIALEILIDRQNESALWNFVNVRFALRWRESEPQANSVLPPLTDRAQTRITRAITVKGWKLFLVASYYVQYWVLFEDRFDGLDFMVKSILLQTVQKGQFWSLVCRTRLHLGARVENAVSSNGNRFNEWQ